MHQCNVFCLELKIAEIELGGSKENEEWEQQHCINCIYFKIKIQHLFITLVLLKEHFILVLYFNSPDIFFVAIFIRHFLLLLQTFSFSSICRFAKENILNWMINSNFESPFAAAHQFVRTTEISFSSWNFLPFFAANISKSTSIFDPKT